MEQNVLNTDLTGKVAVITGASGTLCSIFARALARAGAKMKEIQAVNACRRDAVANCMKLEDAMAKWQTIDQLPAEYQG